MNSPHLYAVLLGGKIRKKTLMEDHHLVFVVAKNEKEARTRAKQKRNAEEIHVDGTQSLETIDGYDIILKKNNNRDNHTKIDNTYSL